MQTRPGCGGRGGRDWFRGSSRVLYALLISPNGNAVGGRLTEIETTSWRDFSRASRVHHRPGCQFDGIAFQAGSVTTNNDIGTTVSHAPLVAQSAYDQVIGPDRSPWRRPAVAARRREV